MAIEATERKALPKLIATEQKSSLAQWHNMHSISALITKVLVRYGELRKLCLSKCTRLQNVWTP